MAKKLAPEMKLGHILNVAKGVILSVKTKPSTGKKYIPLNNLSGFNFIEIPSNKQLIKDYGLILRQKVIIQLKLGLNSGRDIVWEILQMI